VIIIWLLENYKDDTCAASVLLIRVSYAHTKKIPGLFGEVGITKCPVVG